MPSKKPNASENILLNRITELESAYAELGSLLESTNIATIFLDSQLNLKSFTPAAQRLLEIDQSDLHKNIRDISNPFLGQQVIAECLSVLKNHLPSEKTIEFSQHVYYRRTILPHESRDPHACKVILTFQDISSLRCAAKKLELREKQHAVIADLGLVALQTDDVNLLMDKATESIAKTLDAHYAKILEYYPKDKNLLIKAGYGWDKVEVGYTRVSDSIHSQAGFTLQCREPVLVHDLSAEERFVASPLFVDHAVRSGISCVVEDVAHPYGVLSVHSREPGRFTIDDANFLKSIANLLSVALQRKRIQVNLEQSERKLRIAKDSNNFGAFEYIISTGEIIWDNMLSQIWGVEDEETLTFDMFYEGLHPEDRAATVAAIQASTAPSGDGHYYAVYRVINRVTQELYWIEASGQVEFLDGKAHKMIGMVIDITEQKKLENALHEAVHELKLANEKKNEFLATLGHELRNPLAAIHSGIEIIEDDRSEADWALDMMRNNIRLMSRLLDDLLDLTRISRGKITLKKSTTNISQLLTDVGKSFEKAFEQKRQSFNMRVPREPVFVDGDATRLEQIFTNLLTNALKFTPEKGCISVELTRQNSKAMIVFSDSGKGIDPKYFTRIFEPFEQVEAHVGAPSVGLGIGLSLVKQFVTLHGGEIHVSSPGIGRGTSFFVSLPTILVDNNISTEPTKQPLHRLKAGIKVMVVDDNKDASDGLSHMLTKYACEIEQTFTAIDTLEKIQLFRPDAVILDIGLPDLDGHTLLKRIEKTLNYKPLSIALTGFGHREAHEASKAAGFDFHINKPADYSEILELLSNVNECR